MIIRVKQINQSELAVFVAQYSTGSVFSGALLNYVNNSGYLGPQVLYITGDQIITTGQKTFVQTPIVPYTGVQSGTISKQYVDDSINSLQNNTLSFVSGHFFQLTGNNYISGTNVFTGSIYIPTPTGLSQAANKYYVDNISGILNTAISNVSVTNVVFLTGNQLISGVKTFVNSPVVPPPSNSGDAANKFYVDNATLGFQPTGFVNLTGDQTISGNKTFIQSPVIPIGTQSNQAVNLSQLNALGTVIGGITGFAGVASINGSSGASGNVYLQGAGTVTIYQCGPIFYISGATANNTQLYSVNIPLPSGITGINYSFSSGFQNLPNINGTLNFSGNFNIAGITITDYIINPNTGQFTVGFSSAIPGNNFSYTINAIPVPAQVSGQLNTGFLAIQGQQGAPGASPNPRGGWQQGLLYNFLDFVFQTGNYTSYICTTTNISTLGNQPQGTGNGFWQIFSSGAQGPSGNFIYQGNYSNSFNYANGFSATYLGSTYSFTGAGFSSGIAPTGSGWNVIAQQGAIGSLVLQSGSYITGDWTTVSFFFSPMGSGLNQIESWVGRSFQFTGFALGSVVSGFGPLLGGILSGDIYTRNLDNTKTIIQNFTYNSGIYSYISGGLAYTISGYQRIGIDIQNSLSGIDLFSIGIFGFGIS